MIFFDSRKQAKEAARSDEKIVKVDGGYMVMTYSEYNVWKNQK